MKLLKKLSGWFKTKAKFLGGISAIIVFSVLEYFRDKRGRKIINRVMTWQIFFTGNKALKIISTVAIALAAVTVLQSFTLLSKFGALDFVGKILNRISRKELSEKIIP